MKRILILDGTALAFRAFFAIRGLTDEQGRPSGALYGYIMSVLRAMVDHPSDFVVVAWDRPEPTFRHQIYPEYKANREELDQDLRVQFPWMREVTDLLGLPSLDQAGFEADDILASLATQAAAQGWQARMFSNDKDLAQVVAENVLQCPPPKANQAAAVMGPPEVEEKFGVLPKQMIDWQAMVGDSSDNIPGIPGVGPKRATGLLSKYGDLETILSRGPTEEKGKLAENLAAHADDARLARKLVRMITDMDLGPLDAFTLQPKKLPGLLEFCREHGFRTLRERFEKELAQNTPGDAQAPAPTNLATAEAATSAAASTNAADVGGQPEAKRDYQTIDTPMALQTLREGLQQSGGFAFDTETTDIDAMRARLVGMSFCWEDGIASYVPLNLTEPLKGPDGVDPVEYLAAVLADPKLPKFGQNIKYDAHMMRRHGAPLAGIDFDTMLAHFLLHPTMRHNLDELSLGYLGLKKIPTKELLGTGKNALTMDLVPVPVVSEYACEDADATWQLRGLLEKELAAADPALSKLLVEVELPLLGVLERMEANGVAIESASLRKLDRQLEKRQAQLETSIFEAAGEHFNLNSPKQLGPILFEKLRLQDELGIKRVGRTKTGYRTDAATLEKYRVVPIVDQLLEFRQITKLRSTYLEALPRYVNPQTGKVHSSFNQAVASTGRLSSSDPNLQNIPIRTEVGREIRRAFVPSVEGWQIVSADYSQVELRIVAHLSQDPALIQAFVEGADVHARTAALIFADGDQAAVTPEMRSRAKAINFGILYGMGPQRLARDLGIPFNEAREFIDHYFDALPGVRAWLDQTLADATQAGVVCTLLGRQRPVPELQSADGRVRANAENVAVNSPVQGSAADLIKLAMIRVDKRLHTDGFEARMLLQVHDELVFECPPQELESLQQMVRTEMEQVGSLSVPLKVDIGVGPDWATAH
jgi:DNA polymerase I